MCRKTEKFENTKGVVRSVNRRRTANTIDNIKETGNDLQNTTQNTKD
jgi:hypothetical protein